MIGIRKTKLIILLPLSFLATNMLPSARALLSFARDGRSRSHHGGLVLLRPHRNCGIVRFHCTAKPNKKSDLGDQRTVQILPSLSNNTDIHRVVFLRHGESEFNNANVFTGWCDVALTQRGVVESIEAGQVFASHSLTFQKCYCSLLTRSIVTAHRALEVAGIAYTPLEYDWRLNERHYGALQGLSKERTAVRLGRDIVRRWRRSYDARPPNMLPHHPHYELIQKDQRYQHLKDIPLAESLQDCQERVVKAWEDIVKDIAITQVQQAKSPTGIQSRYSLIVAHANTLRALVMHLDDISADDIEGLNIPTAIPFYYDINLLTGKVMNQAAISDNEVPHAAGRISFQYISDERKKRGFLERRRAANDPWLWALSDDQVDNRMLLDDDEEAEISLVNGQLQDLEEEADANTKLFSPNLQK